MWQPIETAPKDGREVLLWDGNACCVGRWLDDILEWVPQHGDWGIAATHWAPLPSPPVPTGCRAKLAPGQWWAFCGETDFDSLPALCTECGGDLKRAGP